MSQRKDKKLQIDSRRPKSLQNLLKLMKFSLKQAENVEKPAKFAQIAKNFLKFWSKWENFFKID